MLELKQVARKGENVFSGAAPKTSNNKIEIDRLKKENARLREERDILKKPDILCQGRKQRFEFMNEYKKEFKIKTMARVSNVSYFWTRSGWLHLAIVMDLFSRKVIGWAMGGHVDKNLTTEAFKMAIINRNPKHKFIHHSDQGAEYTNNEYQNILKNHGIISSMSRSGNCYDNTVAESFFKTIKVELAKKQKFNTIEEARAAIFEYIEIFYNRKRLHSTLGYVSPVEYERRNGVN